MEIRWFLSSRRQALTNLRFDGVRRDLSDGLFSKEVCLLLEDKSANGKKGGGLRFKLFKPHSVLLFPNNNMCM